MSIFGVNIILKNLMSKIILIQIYSLSSVRLVIAKDLIPLQNRENTLKKVSEVLSRFSKEGMPLLDPEEDMKVCSFSLYPCIPYCHVAFLSHYISALLRSKVVRTENQFEE